MPDTSHRYNFSTRSLALAAARLIDFSDRAYVDSGKNIDPLAANPGQMERLLLAYVRKDMALKMVSSR